MRTCLRVNNRPSAQLTLATFVTSPNAALLGTAAPAPATILPPGATAAALRPAAARDATEALPIRRGCVDAAAADWAGPFSSVLVGTRVARRGRVVAICREGGELVSAQGGWAVSGGEGDVVRRVDEWDGKVELPVAGQEVASRKLDLDLRPSPPKSARLAARVGPTDQGMCCTLSPPVGGMRGGA